MLVVKHLMLYQLAVLNGSYRIVVISIRQTSCELVARMILNFPADENVMEV